MRIAVLAHSFPRFPGDTHGTFVKRLSEELAGLGHEVHALVPFDPELVGDPGSPITLHSFRYVWPDRLHLLGYSRTLRRDVGMRWAAWLESPLYFWFAERALRRLVERERIDLVHAHWILPNGYVADRVRRATGVPFAVTLHGSDVFMAERLGLLGRLARRALAGAAHVTSCSADLKERLLETTGLDGDPDAAAKIALVANGTDLVAAEPAETAPDPALRRWLEVPADARLVVAVGRLVDKKGFDVLLEAAPAILDADPRAVLVIGGGGDLRDELVRRAAELDIAERVRFPGPLPHPRVLELLAAAEIFVMPSVRDRRGNVDGLPVVVLEAMAAGRPVVASDIAGMPLAVEDGVTGLLVPERDTMRLAAAVAELLDDPERSAALGAAGRERVERELNWGAIARRHDERHRAAVSAAATTVPTGATVTS